MKEMMCDSSEAAKFVLEEQIETCNNLEQKKANLDFFTVLLYFVII